jgi:hypothetical protein
MPESMVEQMDRRKFLETVLATSAVPAVTIAAPASRAQAVDRPSRPRSRENFNAGWLFARQARGAGELGSFDRADGEAAKVEPRFREAHLAGFDDADWHYQKEIGHVKP